MPANPERHDRLLPHPFVRSRHDARVTMNSSAAESPSTAVRIADSGGVLGAVFAALCCAGTPFIVAGLAAVGLGYVRQDAILWPMMFVSLGVALWGFWTGRRVHGLAWPLVVATLGAIALIAGVVFIHGFPAMPVIWMGVAALIGATVWNVVARRRCATLAR